MMSINKSYATPDLAYDALLSAYWDEAPSVPSARQHASEARFKSFLAEASTIDNAAIAIGSVADEEMLLAQNLFGRGKITEAWTVIDQCQTHGQLMDEIIDHLVWRPTSYSEIILRFSTFCARFALALARGEDRDIRWYAQQVYNLVQSNLADESCEATEYVEFYYVLAVAVLTDTWPGEERVDERLGVYRDLFLDADEPESVRAALVNCAQYHLDLAAYITPKHENDASHPFRTRYTTLFAFELLAWIGLFKRLKGPLLLKLEHPLLPIALFDPPPYQSASSPEVLRLKELAIGEFGDSFLIGLPLKYDRPD